MGSNEKLELGDLSVIRDWGWAPEYVEAMWLMLQQEAPENYIIATGKSHSLQQFVEIVFEELNLDWKKYVHTNKKFIRDNELKTSKANPSLVWKKLGWKAKTDFRNLIQKLLFDEKKLFKKLLKFRTLFLIKFWKIGNIFF